MLLSVLQFEYERFFIAALIRVDYEMAEFGEDTAGRFLTLHELQCSNLPQHVWSPTQINTLVVFCLQSTINAFLKEDCWATQNHCLHWLFLMEA